MAGSEAFSDGRKSSNGAGSTEGASTLTTGSRNSTPPGACGVATTVPCTSSTDSGLSEARTSTNSESCTTIWAKPFASRKMRKLISRRRRSRCSHPAKRTRSPACSPSWVVQIRSTATPPGIKKPPRHADEGATRGATALHRSRSQTGSSLERPLTGANRRGLPGPSAVVPRTPEGLHAVRGPSSQRRQLSEPRWYALLCSVDAFDLSLPHPPAARS